MLRVYSIFVLAESMTSVWCVFGVIPNPSAHLEVYVLPVGQGDCVIIQCPASSGRSLIIYDCGSSGGAGLNATSVRSFLGGRVNDITAILVTHANRDHYSYLPTITNSLNANIRTVIFGGALNEYPLAIRNWLSDFNPRLQRVSNGMSCIGTCTVPGGTNFCNNANINFNILAANVGGTANQRSIVLKVIFGSFSILLSGDMEGDTSEIIASSAISAQLESVVYMMSHHGAGTMANKPEWLAPIKPRRAFASSAYNRGNCRHPRCNTIQNIRDLRTINTGVPPHQFYCGNRGAAPTNDPAFTLDMYQTSPSFDSICLLKYAADGSVDGSFNQNCKAPPALAEFQVSAVVDECFRSGTVGLDVCYPLIVIVALFYF